MCVQFCIVARYFMLQICQIKVQVAISSKVNYSGVYNSESWFEIRAWNQSDGGGNSRVGATKKRGFHARSDSEIYTTEYFGPPWHRINKIVHKMDQRNWLHCNFPSRCVGWRRRGREDERWRFQNEGNREWRYLQSSFHSTYTLTCSVIVGRTRAVMDKKIEPHTELCKNTPRITLKKFRCPPQNSTLAQYFAKPRSPS